MTEIIYLNVFPPSFQFHLFCRSLIWLNTNSSTFRAHSILFSSPLCSIYLCYFCSLSSISPIHIGPWCIKWCSGLAWIFKYSKALSFVIHLEAKPSTLILPNPSISCWVISPYLNICNSADYLPYSSHPLWSHLKDAFLAILQALILLLHIFRLPTPLLSF